jgi:hypothetical protein
VWAAEFLGVEKEAGVYLSLREVLLFDEVRESLSPDLPCLFAYFRFSVWVSFGC